MPRKVSSMYKIERGRTRQKVERPASDLEDSDSEPSVSNESDEEYNAEDGEYNEDEDEEVEVEYQRPRRGQPKPSAGRVTRNTRSSKANSKGSDSGDDESGFDAEKNKKQTRSRKQPTTTRRRVAPTKSPVLPDSDDDEYNDTSDSLAAEEDDLEDEEEKGGKKNRRSQKNMKLVARNISRSTRSSSSRSEGGGDILATLASPSSTSTRRSAVKAKRKLTKTAKEEMKHDDSDDNDDDDDDDDDDGVITERGSGNDEDSDYDDEEEKEVDELLQKKSKDDFLRNNSRSETQKKKRKKAVHSSDEEFLLDSDDDGDDSDDSLSNDDNAELTEDDNDILMIGDPDLSDDDSDHNDIVEKGNNHATNVVNIDNQNFGTIDDEDDDDEPCNDERSPKRLLLARKNEILPSPRGIENAFESDDDQSDEDTAEAYSKITTKFRRKAKCPKCPSTEDAITAEALPELHVCYIAPDGKSRQCFNLETLRQIALKSSQLQLRVDIDGERQNFLQPPAFLAAMSDDLVDQIASKFGRGALDLHCAYYKNRQTKYDNKDEDDEYAYPSDSSSDENIYDSFAAFRERLNDYFKNGLGSQDIYVCPLCYGRIHRTIANPPNSDDDDDDDDDADKEYDAAPSDSIYDPIMVLGHLDNDHMSIASQFCFKKLADVKEHLRQEHNVDTRGIQGNELYKRFRVRAPDGLLQRWLSTQSLGGQVKQGHMRMYWNQGNDQIFIHLLDLMERVKAYTVGSLQSEDDPSEEDGADDELDENANKAREFFDTFATKASRLWKIISSPFLKSNDNINDFIAKDDDYIEEKDPDEQPHAVLHRQFMNSMNEDSDENDLVHKLKRKYAETNDEETDSKCSPSEEELEFVDGDKESDDEDDRKEIHNRNGYYSPVEEEEDEWILKLQSQRKRKTSSQKKQESNNTKIKTPVGKKLFRRKTPPTGTSSSIPGASKKKRILTIEDSSDDESF